MLQPPLHWAAAKSSSASAPRPTHHRCFPSSSHSITARCREDKLRSLQDHDIKVVSRTGAGEIRQREGVMHDSRGQAQQQLQTQQQTGSSLKQDNSREGGGGGDGGGGVGLVVGRMPSPQLCLDYRKCKSAFVYSHEELEAGGGFKSVAASEDGAELERMPESESSSSKGGGTGFTGQRTTPSFVGGIFVSVDFGPHKDLQLHTDPIPSSFLIPAHQLPHFQREGEPDTRDVM
ncbi:unnamed protein product [Pleuronectes platessa]|uniref:Uncharacterized protein n=1 Tax=Pleuronectes platessa TaxID=8262 RepID=A0A9N7YWQ4_PLEPL|nr:unnamed protein product [Pleuronectes platessa]